MRPNRGRRHLLIVALLLSACARPSGQVDEEGRALAAQFLDDVRAGRLEPAWQGTSSEFKSLMGLENLRDYVKTHAALKGPVDPASVRRLERDGRDLAEFSFVGASKVRGKNVPATIKVLLGRGDDGWQVESLVVE